MIGLNSDEVVLRTDGENISITFFINFTVFLNFKQYFERLGDDVIFSSKIANTLTRSNTSIYFSDRLTRVLFF